jgi:hypothetical protein
VQGGVLCWLAAIALEAAASPGRGVQPGELRVLVPCSRQHERTVLAQAAPRQLAGHEHSQQQHRTWCRHQLDEQLPSSCVPPAPSQQQPRDAPGYLLQPARYLPQPASSPHLQPLALSLLLEPSCLRNQLGCADQPGGGAIRHARTLAATCASAARTPRWRGVRAGVALHAAWRRCIAAGRCCACCWPAGRRCIRAVLPGPAPWGGGICCYLLLLPASPGW